MALAPNPNPTPVKQKGKPTIFEDIQNTDDLSHLNNLHKAIRNPRTFEKEMDNALKERRKKLDLLKTSNKEDEIHRIEIEISTLQKEKELCLRLSIEFRRMIESSSSPQETEDYVNLISAVMLDILEYPEDEENPLITENYISVLKKAYQALKKNKVKKTEHIEPLTEIPLLLGLTEPSGSIEEDMTVRLEQALEKAKIKSKESYRQRIRQICQNEDGQTDRNKEELIKKKYEILTTLKKYARVSTHNFDQRINFSNTLYSLSSICAILSQLATFSRMIPGANLIAEGVSKTFDFLTYLFLTAAQATDPNISKERRLATRRHFAAMKYNITEAAIAGFGTLALIASVIVITFAAASPLIAPILLIAGGVTLTISNIMAAERYRKEVKSLTFQLEKNPLFSRKAEILAKGNQGIENLKTAAEKAFYKDAKKIEALQYTYHEKISDAIGSTLLTALAVSALLTIAFPPAGAILTATVLTAITAATAITALYSLYKNRQAKKQYTQFKNIEEDIEKDKVKTALEAINRPKRSQELEHEAVPLRFSPPLSPSHSYTPSFDHAPKPEPAQEEKEKREREPPRPL